MPELPPVHVIGDNGSVDLLLEHGPFGDVRDVLVNAKHWGHHGYATADLFTVRYDLIRELVPQPRSVFEFGSLLGYFLLTALDAAPSISRVGWIDTETDVPDSNEFCLENIADYAERHGRDNLDVFYDTRTRACLDFTQADLVQVDGAHSYPDCLTDLVWASMLRPHTIFVDDYAAIDEVRRATDEFAAWRGLEVEYHETVNGLAVLRLGED